MSTISSRFFVEAIDDGSTLHGSLLSTKPLTQAWVSGDTAVPDWRTPANQPTVYVDLVNGTERVAADAGGTWYYNGNEIDFTTDTRFVLVNDYTPSGFSHPVPAIRIVSNLATSQNVNIDSLNYDGSYTLAGAAIGFSVGTFVRITSVTAVGGYGIVYFLNSSIVTQDHQKVYMYGEMYGADGTLMDAGAYSTQWFLNEESIGNGDTIEYDGHTYRHGKIISEDDSLGAAKEIVDNSVVACTFTKISDPSISFTVREEVDDRTDPEQMYIQYSGGDGINAQLHAGQSITFSIWMGKMDDSTPDTSWNTFAFKLLKSDGTEYTDVVTGINNVGQDGWRTYNNPSGSVVTLTFSYNVVKTLFQKYLTVIARASK